MVVQLHDQYNDHVPAIKNVTKMRKRLRKGVSLLPNILTISNAFFGFCSVVFTSNGDLVGASYFILLSALMDALDGRVARMTNSTSKFGLELDSLCDAISFCLAPAFLVYSWQLKKFGFLGLMASAFFLATGLLRLAKFNLTHGDQKNSFLGIPTTVAACLLATILFNSGSLYFKTPFEFLLLFLVLLLGSLMVSTFPFPTFKHVKAFIYPVFIIIVFAFSVIMGFSKVLLVGFALYFCFALEEYLRIKLIARKTPQDMLK